MQRCCLFADEDLALSLTCQEAEMVPLAGSFQFSGTVFPTFSLKSLGQLKDLADRLTAPGFQWRSVRIRDEPVWP